MPVFRKFTRSHFSYDQHKGILVRAGNTTVFRPKTAAVFSHLLNSADRIVSKSELLEELWSDVTVQEQAVFQSIAEIRQAFDGDECIRTHPKKGYQWVGAQPVRNMSPHLVFAALLGAVIIISSIYWAAPIKPNAPTKEPYIFLSITGQENAAARDIGVPANLSDMLTHHVSANSIGTVTQDRDDAALTAELQVTRQGRALTVDFTIDGGSDEVVKGSYTHTSITWLTHQIAYQLHDAITCELSADATPERTALHQQKIQAEHWINQGEHGKAKTLLQEIVEADPSYLSVQYALLTLKTDNNSDAPITAFIEAAHAQQDAFNEIRGLSLLAKSNAALGHYSQAVELAEQVQAMAHDHHYPYLAASMELARGRWQVATGNHTDALAWFLKAADTYQLIECPAGEIIALELLAEQYEKTENYPEAETSRNRATALRALGY